MCSAELDLVSQHGSHLGFLAFLTLGGQHGLDSLGALTFLTFGGQHGAHTFLTFFTLGGQHGSQFPPLSAFISANEVTQRATSIARNKKDLNMVIPFFFLMKM